MTELVSRMSRPLAPLLIALSVFVPAGAHAFCGFYVGGAETSLYNDASMVVLMREGTRTVLSMQNSYQGPPERFAMVVPVPVVLQEDDVRTLPRDVFGRVDRLAAPRLVEYWEQDPCQPPRPERRMRRRSMAPRSAARGRAGGGGADLGVTVEAEFSVGEYDIVILSARDSGGLDTWLRQEGYHIPQGAEAALRPYVEQGTKFFVARVDPSRVTFENGRAMLSPLRFHYDSDTFSLPIRLGLINSSGTQDLIVHVLARNQRYEVANYPNAFIPTNVEVRPNARARFGAFYASLFDKTMEVNPGAVVTEYSWQAGSCDPCPGPTLTGSDIMTLGGDVVGAGQAAPGPRRGRRRFFGNPASAFTLTRLHYRYGPGAADADLVFRAAPAVVGGRGTPDPRGRFERDVQQSSVNNFQGRYAILHRWRGPVTCEQPRRGIWGGPPNGAAPRAEAALDLATQPRRGVRLQRFLRRGIPELARPNRRRRGGAGRAPAPLDRSGWKASLTPMPAREVGASAAMMGCRVNPRSAAPPVLLLGALGIGLFFVSRRRS